MKQLITITLISMNLIACGQSSSSHSSQNKETMDLSKITHDNVRSAISALQQNNIQDWYAHFTNDPTFTDDGNKLDFKKFFDNAFDKKEKFLEIDTVENEGKDIYGSFYAGQWGTFRVYFKFTENKEGKFSRLDIGQTKK